MTEEEAIAYVTTNAQTETLPCLSTEEVEEIVRRNMRAQVWAEETDYTPGDVIRPTTPNGHFYTCLVAGSSAASADDEPDWPTRQFAQVWEVGSDLLWEECEKDFAGGNLYNLRNAIHEAWVLKAAKSAKDFDLSIENQKFNRSQVHAACLDMAQRYAPFD